MAAYQSQAVDPNVTPLDGLRPASAWLTCRPPTVTSPARRIPAGPRC